MRKLGAGLGLVGAALLVATSAIVSESVFQVSGAAIPQPEASLAARPKSAEGAEKAFRLANRLADQGQFDEAMAAPCHVYAEGIDGGNDGYREVNNCPPATGTFQNERWRVEFGRWEPAAFVYRGTNRLTGDSIQVVHGEVRGTTDRPQYLFRNANTVYVVSFQADNANVIRVEVWQSDRRILNQLLTRIAD